MAYTPDSLLDAIETHLADGLRRDAAALGRVVEPAQELLTLADYRTRHAQYRSDPDAQAPPRSALRGRRIN